MTPFVSCPDGVRRKEMSPRCCMAAVYVLASDRLLAGPFVSSFYLFISSAAACLLPHISACLFFVLWQMFQRFRSLYETVQQRSKKKNIFMWMRASVRSPQHCATNFLLMPNQRPGGTGILTRHWYWFHDRHSLA